MKRVLVTINCCRLRTSNRPGGPSYGLSPVARGREDENFHSGRQRTSSPQCIRLHSVNFVVGVLITRNHAPLHALFSWGVMSDHVKNVHVITENVTSRSRKGREVQAYLEPRTSEGASHHHRQAQRRTPRRSPTFSGPTRSGAGGAKRDPLVDLGCQNSGLVFQM